MVDQEVVDILAEIRQRVASAQVAPSVPAATQRVGQQGSPNDSEVVKRHFASLSVLDRAWDRLPPIVSKRTGTPAKFELWIKSKLKRALRWLTWEQVNFNAATRQTFVEVIETLAAYEQQLALRHSELSMMQDEFASQREQLERQQGELNAQRSLLFSQQTDIKERFDVLENTIKDFQSQTVAEARARFDDLLKEFRERDERLLDEQRVCFKQLRLELSESQVLQDRARRELDVRVGKLEKEKRKN
ncbi:MAG TPA: hypothetical protein VJ372_05320 [Pyrinomonadaceae bacterium]|jgi:hypothetical protein|nr:hypothetical protein [Pyrinomonadaceae bacterium]